MTSVNIIGLNVYTTDLSDISNGHKIYDNNNHAGVNCFVDSILSLNVVTALYHVTRE